LKKKLEKNRYHAHGKQADSVPGNSDGDPDLVNLSPDEIRSLVHQLQVHQHELEAQNEMLRESEIDLQAARNKFSDLYDFAPAGYATLSKKGVILEANLVAADMLGETREALLGEFFYSRYVSRNSKDEYYLRINSLLKTKIRSTFDLELSKKNGTRFFARLDCVPAEHDGKVNSIRMSIIDITDLKRAEEELTKKEHIIHTIVENIPDRILTESLLNGH